MKKSIVALLPCSRYEEETVYASVKKGLELIGGLSSLLGKDEKILVKPNLLYGAAPEKAVTTHPSVFGAVLRCLREEGYADVAYGDSSGSPSADMRKTAETAGLTHVAERYDVPMADFETPVAVSYPEGRVAKKFVLCKAVTEADAIVSVCKMKTHALEKITGAVKNQYGCVCAANKAIGHAKYPNSRVFADMVVDLDMYLKPRLYVMDGVLAMEGNGPGSGDPVFMNCILISTDPVAIDAVFAKLIDLDPELVPTIGSGERAGLGHADPAEIAIVTPDGEISADEAFSRYGKPDFNVDRRKQNFWRLRSLLAKSKPPKHRPVVDPEKCIACGICEKSCPVEGKAVHSGNGKKAEYDYTKCIRCYCCQEMCPAKAISRQE